MNRHVLISLHPRTIDQFFFFCLLWGSSVYICFLAPLHGMTNSTSNRQRGSARTDTERRAGQRLPGADVTRSQPWIGRRLMTSQGHDDVTRMVGDPLPIVTVPRLISQLTFENPFRTRPARASWRAWETVLTRKPLWSYQQFVWIHWGGSANHHSTVTHRRRVGGGGEGEWALVRWNGHSTVTLHDSDLSWSYRQLNMGNPIPGAARVSPTADSWALPTLLSVEGGGRSYRVSSAPWGISRRLPGTKILQSAPPLRVWSRRAPSVSSCPRSHW